MRRRIHRDNLTDRDVVRLYTEAIAAMTEALPDERDPRRPAYLGDLLARYGIDVVDAIAARRRLRRASAGTPTPTTRSNK